jgi:hypothetical protein
MRRILTAASGRRALSNGRHWAGVYINPSDFGPGGVTQHDEQVSFMSYDGTPYCNTYSLTFKTLEEAEKFVEWHEAEKPNRVHDWDGDW